MCGDVARAAIQPHDRRRVVVRADGEAMERDVGALYESLAHASARLIAGYSTEELGFLVGHLTRNNALMLEEAVKLRHHTAAGAEASAGEELSGGEVVVPLGAVEAGHLVVTTGATRLTLGGGAGSEELLRAHFGRLAPSGLVKVFYRQALLNWSANSADIQLSPRAPWRLDLVSSGASCRADLRAITLSGLEVNGKASSVDATLPHPTTTVPVRIAGSAGTVVLRRARGTELQLLLQRGAADVTVDGEVLEGAPGRPYQTSAYATADERYEIEVTARLTTVQIETSA